MMGDVWGVTTWFEQWGECVAAADFAGARALFVQDVVGFGTYRDRVKGLDALEHGQWRSIWPSIRDFAFDLNSLEILFSPDARQAVAMIIWNSTGIRTDGTAYPRPGRATVVLRRDEGVWRGLHTHFSLSPAASESSFGDELCDR